MKYTLKAIEACCPVCANQQARTLYTVCCGKAALHLVKDVQSTDYLQLFEIVRHLLEMGFCNVVCCDTCGFVFPYPYISGNKKNYKLDYSTNVYPVWKCDFQVTLE